jgi:[ribosomal protein S5]-alanine N-acetyltransferase
MIYDQEIKGKKIILKMLEFEDCNYRYLSWLKDKEVNQFLETRWEEQTLEKIQEFVNFIRNSKDSYLFAIIYKKEHIGNIKIGPIHPIYKFADISYFIGEKSAWEKGIATEAICLITRFAFEELGLNRLQAGAYATNIGSQKALEKNYYKKEATYRKKAFINIGDEYIDSYMYGILKDEWKK